jgi:muramoyltetrapeptide carboxypeptidase
MPSVCEIAEFTCGEVKRVDAAYRFCVACAMRFPPPLKAGSRVALAAPSGPLRDETDLTHAVENVRAFDCDPIVGEHVLARDGYLAGSDALRLADLNRFAADDSIDAVWCIRGGYGAMRLLDEIDYDAWCRRPRALIGYSDITALHAAVGSRAELITYHGPTARAALTHYTRDAFARAVRDEAPLEFHERDMTTLHPGRARGRLVGGNLALVSALVGTPYELDLEGAILVLEDISESVYRLDRMLTQLRLSGAFTGVAGIAFGHFTEIPDDAANVDRPLDRVLAEVAAGCGVPCVANFPIGHIDDQVTLPLGATAELDADTRILIVER